MSYKIKTHGKIGESLQKVARDEIRKIVAELNPRNPAEAAKAVHSARKHLKKLRALVRFARLEMSSNSFKTENACFRDAGRKLRDLRDAQVLVNSIDKLRRHFFRGASSPLLSLARKRLAMQAQQALKGVAENGAVEGVSALLSEALPRVKAWRLADFGWKEARRAIERSYRQSRRAFRAAAADPSVENLHEWRKRAKDFWYHTRLLRRASPETFAELGKELHTLTELIGDDHDFAMLSHALEQQAPSLRGGKKLDTFLTLLQLRRKELQQAAFALAERLFANRPSRFARSIARDRTLRRTHSRLANQLESQLAA